MYHVCYTCILLGIKLYDLYQHWFTLKFQRLKGQNEIYRLHIYLVFKYRNYQKTIRFIIESLRLFSKQNYRTSDAILGGGVNFYSNFRWIFL